MKLSLSPTIAAGTLALLVFMVTGCGKAPLAPTGATNYDAYPTLGEDTGSTVPLDATGPGCAASNVSAGQNTLQVMASEPAAAALSSDPELSTFSSLINRDGLGDYLNYSQSAVTVFAPDDQAFDNLRNKLGAPEYAALTANRKTFSDLLKSLMVAERDNRNVLLEAGTVHTLANTILRLNSGPTGMSIASPSGPTANVICGNIPTQNAIVHVIDNVVAQPSLYRSSNQVNVNPAAG